jgi:putative nucleotidyltransferase with HDIG domain
MLAHIAVATAVSVAVAALVSPGLSGSIPRYELGQYTTRAVRAPFEYSVVDEAATRQRREEAARRSPPVLVLDRSVVTAIGGRLADVFGSMAEVFAEQDRARHAAEGGLEKLTRAQRAAREKRADAAAARFLQDHLATAWPAFEQAVGVAISPEERAALVHERFDAQVTAAAKALLENLYARPIVEDLAQIRDLVDGTAPTRDGPGRLTLRNRSGGGERTIADLSLLQDRSDAIRSLPDRAKTVLAAPLPQLRQVLVRIIGAQVRANVTPDAETTRARRAAAAEAVIPVSLNFHRNQMIIGEGQQVTHQTVIALDALRQRVRPAAYYQRVAGFAVLFLLLLLVFGSADLADVSSPPDGTRRFVYLAATFSATVLLFRLWLLVVDGLVALVPSLPPLGLVLLFPVASAAVLTALVLDRTSALLHLAAVAVTASVLSESGALLAGYLFVVGLVGTARIRACTDRRCVLRGGIVAGIAGLPGSVVLLLLAASGHPTAPVALGICAMGIAGGVLMGPAVVAASPIVEWAFGYSSNLTLLEMLSFEHPLLRRIMLEAPGTFQHSLAISILADASTEAIGGNSLLARVGALYHDAGKILHRDFFVENQAGENPHDHLSPQESARVLCTHVTDGVALVHRYGLGDRIALFVREHHGTSSMQYFVAKKSQERDAGGRGQTQRQQKGREPERHRRPSSGQGSLPAAGTARSREAGEVDLHAREEHQEDESQLRQQMQERVLVRDQSAAPQHDAGQDLADDDRKPKPLQTRKQQRHDQGQTDDDEQRREDLRRLHGNVGRCAARHCAVRQMRHSKRRSRGQGED